MAVLTSGHTGHVPRAPDFFLFERPPTGCGKKVSVGHKPAGHEPAGHEPAIGGSRARQRWVKTQKPTTWHKIA